MKFRILYFALFFCLSPLFSQKEIGSFEIGKRYSIESKILEQTRNYVVSLPHSYGSSDIFKYPVLYIIDGEYNFRHISGLVEQLSSISEKIPEMIVVGISDAGQPDYKKNSTPFDKKSNPEGQSEKFLKFITDELKPALKNSFSIADYDILAGHSLGGLFTVNALLSEPTSFNAYIAISPSLWWDDYAPEKAVAPFFDKNKALDRFLYLSVGDEVGMGVAGFYNQIQVKTFEEDYLKKEPLGLNYTFQQYPDDNHGSVGLITVDNALRKLFSNYYLPYPVLQNLKSFKEFTDYMKPFQRMLGSDFRLPPRHLNSIISNFYENEKELALIEKVIKEEYPSSLSDFYIAFAKSHSKKKKHEKAIEMLEKNYKLNPKSSDALLALGEAYSKKGENKKAKEIFEKAYEIAKINNARQWYLNYLKGHFPEID